MNVTRSFGKAIGSLILVLSISFLITLLGLVEFTTYDNLNQFFTETLGKEVTKNLSNEQIIATHSQLVDKCKGEQTIEVPLGDLNVTLKCSDVLKSRPEELGNLLSSAMFSEMYYKDYKCNSFECYKMVVESFSSGKRENMLFIFSQKSNQLLNQLSMHMWIGVALGVAIIIVSEETWLKRFKTIGMNCIVIAVLFFVLFFIKDFMIEKIAGERGVSIPAEQEAAVNSLIGILFNSLLNKNIILLIIGAIIAGIGFALGYKEKKVKL